MQLLFCNGIQNVLVSLASGTKHVYKLFAFVLL